MRRHLYRFLAAALSGAAVALLVSCASSGSGLIPSGSAGPLQTDFEEVERAALHGDGSCTATEAAISKTEQDFANLPQTVNEGLRKRLHEGISKLHADALKLCSQPLPQTTATSAPARPTTSSTSSTTTPATTPTTPTQTSSTTPSGANSGPQGGAQAPSGEGSHSGEQGGGTRAGEGKGTGEPRGTGEGKGEAGSPEGALGGAGQEAGK